MNQAFEKFHILYLARWYPNRYDPMPGLFIERHARSAAAYCNVSVLYVHADTHDLKKKFEIGISQDKELYQVKIYFRSSKSRLMVYRQFLNLIRFLRAHYMGFRMIRKEKAIISLVHVNVLTRLGIIALIYKLFTGIPYGFYIFNHW